ncbi:hypothetical protein FHT76_004309 [Rhizobium sp. BK176]|nr:hypothetical protein [Rhizobium sp. BK176]
MSCSKNTRSTRASDSPLIAPPAGPSTSAKPEKIYFECLLGDPGHIRVSEHNRIIDRTFASKDNRTLSAR